MEPRKRTDKIEVNLGDIFGLLLHRMWMILLAGFICGAVGFIYSNFFITPQYQSTTKVYILNKQNSTSVTAFNNFVKGLRAACYKPLCN